MRNFLLKILFIVLWPLIFLYAPLNVRSRILIIKNGKFLGVRHYFGNNLWNLPGGGVKKGESYKDAAVRELYEELCIALSTKDVHELLGVHTYNERGLFMRYVIFVAEIKGDIELSPSHEISETRWLPAHATGVSKHAAQAAQQAVGQAHLIK